MAESTISAGTSIRGRIRAEGDLEIHGHVEGSIEGDGVVTIGSDAALKSSVTGRSVLVSGAVAGNLHGSELVVLEEGARVVGDLSAPSIGIRPGALLRGRVETGAGGPPKVRPGAKPAKAAPSKAIPSKAVPSKAAPSRAVPSKAVPSKAAPSNAVSNKAGKRAAPPPVMPKAGSRAVKVPARPEASAEKRGVPEPKLPALAKRAKKASKRRAR